MNGEKKLVLVVIGIVALCLLGLYMFLFISLWPYRVWVGASLLALLAVVVLAFVRGKLNEQDLRWSRYRHQEETPLDARGEPYYWHQGMQVNPHRMAASAPMEPERDQGYPVQGSQRVQSSSRGRWW